MKTWIADFSPWKSKIHINGSLPSIYELLNSLDAKGRKIDHEGPILIVCDTNTLPYARQIAGSRPRTNIQLIPSGEEYKNFSAVETILNKALSLGMGRDSLFIGVGGGVICDLLAFAASIWMRGVALALVPTTLLAMVDAAIGGKTGCDFGGLKNTIGTFRPADLVYIAVDTLKTLPQREWQSGKAEVLKTAILGEKRLFKLLEDNSEDWAPEISQEIIQLSVRFKIKIVEADPQEKGTLRATLNLGHTFGHALEALCNFKGISHGEAVAWGIGRATALASSLSLISTSRVQRIEALLERYSYCNAPQHPLGLSQVNGNRELWQERLLSAMQGDKKKKEGRVRFVLPNNKGAALMYINNKDDIVAVL